MTQSENNPWLHRFAIATALATLVLLCFGGLVTSHGAGLAVPDWPNSYGYNMFLFPISKWVGGIFYEHTHRLVASFVGFLTVILTFWLWKRDSRRWMKRLGIAALFLVIVQGVMGGLRVTLLKDEIGIIHATLAQLFFVLISAIALFTSPWWRANDRQAAASKSRLGLGGHVGWVTLLILTQLVLGAAMRHQHAGLAIPDFPLAYGKLWPDLDADSIARYNQHRLESSAANPITATAIVLQMAHRFLAAGIFLGVASAAVLTRRKRLGDPILTRASQLWFGLICIQVALGAFTIWTGKSADIATTHVAVGALSLVTGALFFLMIRRQTTAPELAEPSTPRTVPTPDAAVLAKRPSPI